MQTRISTCIGATIVEESSESVLGMLADVLIHPDTGKIEGFYIQVSGGFGSSLLFCRAIDVIRFGTRIYVRSAEVLCDPHEIVRLHTLLEDRRCVLGQPIRTESGQKVGCCKDVQFDTESMKMGWIFPKRFFRWRRGIAVSDIVEIRSDGIIVRDAPRPIVEEVEEHASVFDPLEVAEPSVSRIEQ